MNFFLKTLALLLLFSSNLKADEVCISMVSEIESNFNDLRALPLGISGQIQIDHEAQGLRRFRRVGHTLLVDAERVPLLSEKRKEFYPIEGVSGFIRGIHISTKTHRTYHNGVEVFNASISYDDPEQRIQLFQGPVEPYYFKNFQIEGTPYRRDSVEGMTWLLSHGEDREVRWSQHSFIFHRMNEVDEFTRLNLFFETDFDNTNSGEGRFVLNWIENSASGSRIDTCVYFLIEAD